MALDKGKVMNRTIDRRKVVVGTAWSVPVIAVAMATPARAVSPDAVVITPGTGPVITDWKGDHHYGSEISNPTERDYDFPITVTDAAGNPVVGASVTVTTSGTNRDGDVLAAYVYPAPLNGGPENEPHPTATAVTGADGKVLFAISTQNLSLGERPSYGTITTTVTYNGTTTVSVVNVTLTDSD